MISRGRSSKRVLRFATVSYKVSYGFLSLASCVLHGRGGIRTLSEFLKLRHRPRDPTPDLRRAPRKLRPPWLFSARRRIIGFLGVAEQRLPLRAYLVRVPLLLDLCEHGVEFRRAVLDGCGDGHGGRVR